MGVTFDPTTGASKGLPKPGKPIRKVRLHGGLKEAFELIKADGHWHRIAETIAIALGHPKKKVSPVSEGFEDIAKSAEAKRLERMQVSRYEPGPTRGATLMDRFRTRRAIRSRGREDIRQSRLKARAEAGGNIGARAKLASGLQGMTGGRMSDKWTARLGCVGSGAFSYIHL